MNSDMRGDTHRRAAPRVTRVFLPLLASPCHACYTWAPHVSTRGNAASALI